jgi:hypothetical protein
MKAKNGLLWSAPIAPIWIAAMVSTAYAHGGVAGPDELGPPVITSAALGILCYWIVVMWPSRRERDSHKPNKVVRRMVR